MLLAILTQVAPAAAARVGAARVVAPAAVLAAATDLGTDISTSGPGLRRGFRCSPVTGNTPTLPFMVLTPSDAWSFLNVLGQYPAGRCKRDAFPSPVGLGETRVPACTPPLRELTSLCARTGSVVFVPGWNIERDRGTRRGEFAFSVGSRTEETWCADVVRRRMVIGDEK